MGQEEVAGVMEEWGFQDAATAECFLKTRQRKQAIAATQARKQLMKVPPPPTTTREALSTYQVVCDLLFFIW